MVKNPEYFAKSLSVTQKDPVGKEKLVEVYEEKNKSNATLYKEMYIHHTSSHLILSTTCDLCNSIFVWKKKKKGSIHLETSVIFLRI